MITYHVPSSHMFLTISRQTKHAMTMFKHSLTVCKETLQRQGYDFPGMSTYMLLISGDPFILSILFNPFQYLSNNFDLDL